MLYNTTLHLAAINSNEACTKVIKSTKSVLESLKPSEDFGAWYPKGQLISERNFGVFKSPNKQFFKG